MNPLPLVDAAEAPVPPGPERLVLRELDLERQLAELRLALLGPRVGRDDRLLVKTPQIRAPIGLFRPARLKA